MVPFTIKTWPFHRSCHKYLRSWLESALRICVHAYIVIIYLYACILLFHKFRNYIFTPTFPISKCARMHTKKLPFSYNLVKYINSNSNQTFFSTSKLWFSAWIVSYNFDNTSARFAWRSFDETYLKLYYNIMKSRIFITTEHILSYITCINMYILLLT